MKRSISLWLGLLAFALTPMLADTPMGKIHGHVTNAGGFAEKDGTVILTVIIQQASGPGLHDEKTLDKGKFIVDDNGDYAGEVAAGVYTLIYRAKGIDPPKQSDHIEAVKIVAGQDTLQNIDMTRKEYLDAMSSDERKLLEEYKKKNASVVKDQEIVKGLNADLAHAGLLIKEADNPHDAAVKALGATASKAELDAKEAEIKKTDYTEVETVMTRDTGVRPNESVLWVPLAQAEVGLKKWDDGIADYKKVLEVEATAKKPNLSAQGSAQAGLGEIYAHTHKIPEAMAAYDEAAKINPPQAAFYLKNEAIIYFQIGEADAQVATADKAIALDPTQAILYYIKGQGLITKATVDEKSGRYVLPPGCAEAYQKFLQLEPTGPRAAEVKGILDQSTQKLDTNTTYKATKPKK